MTPMINRKYNRLEFAAVLAAAFAAPVLGQTVDELTDELLAQANSVFKSGGYRLSSSCEGLLRDWVRAGAVKLIAEDSLEKLPDARENIRKLATQMIEERTKTANGVIDDQAFQKAKSAVCPLYPFC
jgi:hypothetical protein